MKLAIVGYGKMGKAIERIAISRGHEIYAVIKNLAEIPMASGCDCAIEFTKPESAITNIQLLSDMGINTVSGTTGWLDHFTEVSDNLAANKNGFIYASNFSIGVNVFFEINKKLASALKGFGYQGEISEIHHTEKLDAPSGTAITLAQGIIENTKYTSWQLDKSDNEDEIIIKAFRNSGVKGTHHIYWKNKIDTITLSHEAHTRDGFATGAVLAAEWLQGKSGIYTMKDVLNL